MWAERVVTVEVLSRNLPGEIGNADAEKPVSIACLKRSSVKHSNAGFKADNTKRCGDVLFLRQLASNTKRL